MKVHHIGYLVKSIDKSIGRFLELGYTIQKDKAYDQIRNINICFLENGGFCVELIEGVDKNSFVFNLYNKYNNTAYHICYISTDINKDIDALSLVGYTVVGKTEIAPCIENRKVVFLYNKNIGFIELVEEDKI